VTEADLIQALVAVQADLDAQFQFWISITFAVLVASFIGGSRLTGRIRLLIVLLYLGTTFILVLRFYRGMDYFYYTRDLFEQYGFGAPPTPRRLLSISQVRAVLFLAGTMISTAFVLLPKWWLTAPEHEKDDP
jgi:hypothetical protein